MSDGSLSQDEIDALLQESDNLEIDTAFGGGPRAALRGGEGASSSGCSPD